MTPTPEMRKMARECVAKVWKARNENAAVHFLMAGQCDNYREVQAALTAIMELRAWRPMSDAPKDGTPILAVVAANDSRHLGHLAGRIFSIKHEGITAGGYDMGWAVYPGLGGCLDDYFAGWLPCPVLPSATGSI